MPKKLNYSARNFTDIRTELINFVRQYYGNLITDFNDSAVSSMLIDLQSGIGDILSYNTDKSFQETQIDYAQERKSVLSMARTHGLKIPGKRPSVTIVDFSVTVPVLGDSFDVSYAPTIRMGSQVTGAGKVFETMDDIDFSSPFTTGGIPNRLIIPNTNSNGTIINYTLTKREILVNGYTKIFKRVINSSDVRPFLELVLPDDNVLSIESVISLNGVDFTKDPTLDQFLDDDNRWYEVETLAEDKIFVEDTIKLSDNAGIKPGKLVHVDRKFISEYTDLGFCKVILGGGSQDISSLNDFDTNSALISQIGNFINNLSLGEVPKANTTMFVKYRVGGGAGSNLGPNVLTGKGNINMIVNGNDPAVNNAVQASLKVNNPIPALGGKDEMSVDEIRNVVRYNFSAQNRCVVIKDYQSRISLMNGKFGVPFRCGVFEEQNKIKVYTLGLDANNNLTNSATSTLNENIGIYLSKYRMMNDYVSINSGRIINLGFEIDLFIDKQYPQSQIISQAIQTVASYMDISKFQMGQNIYLSDLVEQLNNVKGITNVLDLRVYNNVGGGLYSMNEIAQPYKDASTREIDLLGQYCIFGDPINMNEVKYVDRDIKIRVKS